jgi:hypothetical protein
MNFKNDSIKEIGDLAKKEEFAYFFANMESKKDQVPDALIEKIALIFMNEFNIKIPEQDKVEFFIKLGFFAGK